MSIIFTANFDNPLLTLDWNLVPVGSATYPIGCGGTRCLTCGVGLSTGVRKNFSPAMAQGTFRFQFAYFSGGATGQVGHLIRILTLGAANYTLEFLVNPDGSIQAFNQFGLFGLSPTGIMPTNGAWLGMQVTVNLRTAPGGPGLDVLADVQIIANNSVVWAPTLILGAFNYGSSPIPATWDGVEFLGTTGGSGSSFGINAIDSVEVDNTINVITYNACSANPGALFVGSCTFVATVSDGIYKIVNGSNKTNDTVYTSLSPVSTTNVAIPDPLAITGFIGDE